MTLKSLPIISEAELALVASIMGEQSAAAHALKNISERRDRGESPICVREGATLYVLNEKEAEGA